MFKQRLMTAFSNVDKHDIFVMSGSLAYATALAMAPFMLIILSLTSWLSADLQRQIFHALSMSMDERVASAVIAMIENADSSPKLSGLSGVIGLIVLAISASVIFSQLKIALDKINEHANTKAPSGVWNFLKKKLFSLGLVFVFAFLSVGSLIFTMLIAIFFPEGVGFLWALLSFALNFALFSLVFTAIYRFVPTHKASLKSCIISGVISTVFYLIGKQLIGLYLGRAGLESSYGAAGSLIVLLVWVYYTALTLLFSYEFTRDVILKNDLTLET